ncbi:AAA family ATPase [Nodosilinea nodulosa]|uniref:WD40 domain-containing protein n=1 Tax=Nodosilinea nodulosa TaxID=416001 RepID=UPI0002D3F085|nr:AAA family ATPase [Nodosilinea nodulosa]
MAEEAKESSQRRLRGAVLSPRGLTRLRAAIRATEQREFEGRRLNLQELGDYIRIAPKTVRKVLKRQFSVDLSTLELCFSAFQVPLDPEDLNYPQSPTEMVAAAPAPRQGLPHTDWGTAPDGEPFYGRQDELTQLTQWIQSEGCRSVTVLGLGGVGKTTLVAHLAHRVAPQFDAVIWRSLRQAPPFELLLGELVTFLSDHQSLEPILPNLMEQLRRRRCLIVLDNLDAVLQTGSPAGHYQPGYEAYGELLSAVGSASHASCLVLTSREKPFDVAIAAADSAPVRIFALTGSATVTEGILQSKQLTGSEAQRQALSQHYDHHPLVLNIVAASIEDLFGGDLGLFLAQEMRVFSGVRWLLDQQFSRLSDLERTVSYWIAINREWTSAEELVADLLPGANRAEVLQALESLRWRSLLEQEGDRYSQQPVIMEYVLAHLLDAIYDELSGATPLPRLAAANSPALLPLPMFSRYALVKTTVRDYVRQAQVRLILKPLAERLRSAFGAPEALEQQLQRVLALLRPLEQWTQQGYGTGNWIDLVTYLGLDLTGYDFSGLPIWQAYLQTTPLHRVRFTGAHFRKSRFADVFGIVLALAFSPDGQRLAVGDSSGSVRIHGTSDLQTQSLFVGHSSRVMSVDWSPSGQLLASASMDGSARLWNTHTGQEIAVLEGHENLVMSVRWHPTGALLATGSEDHNVHLWDAATGELRQVWRGHTDSVRSVCWSPDGSTLVSASADGTLRLWDLGTGESQVLTGHSDSLWAVEWSPDGQWLASGGEDGTVRLWQAQGDHAVQVLVGHTEWIWSLRFSADSRRLASGSRDRTIRLWDVATGTRVKVLKAHPMGVSALGWHPHQPLLASGGVDQLLRLWDTDSGHALRFLQGFTTSAWAVAWNPCATLAADRPELASGHQDGSVWLWRRGTGVPLRRLNSHARQIWELAWSPDGETLACSGDDGTVQLWNTTTGNPIKSLRGHRHDRIWAVAWSPSGHLLASGGGDAAICLWDPTTHYCLQCWQAHASDVVALQFSPDGQWLASGSEDQTLRFWDLKTGELGLTLAGHTDRITQIQFSPSGALMASASEDRTIRLWQVSTGECLSILQGHDNRVWDIQFSPDGQKLISGSTDRTARIWDLSTGVCETILSNYECLLWSVGWSADGQTVATGGEDGLVKLWSVAEQRWIATLRGDRLYEGMQIQGATGLSAAAIAGLQKLGAIAVS